jgi:hypothetical protein
MSFAIVAGAGVAAAGAIGGAVISSQGAKSAADTQAAAADNAAQLTYQAQQQMRTDLQPYSSLGSGSINALLQAMGYTGAYDSNGNLTGLTANKNSILQTPFSFDASNLASTPGYQFTLSQGMKGVTNSNVARGLGLSGAQLKGISDYTTGNADSTYNTQYANALNTYDTNYANAASNANRLASLVQTGQNSAAQVGSSGLTAAGTAGNQLTSGANAQAAATVAGANAASGALTSTGNNALLLSLLRNSNTGSTSGSLYTLGSGTGTGSGGTA